MINSTTGKRKLCTFYFGLNCFFNFLSPQNLPGQSVQAQLCWGLLTSMIQFIDDLWLSGYFLSRKLFFGAILTQILMCPMFPCDQLCAVEKFAGFCSCSWKKTSRAELRWLTGNTGCNSPLRVFSQLDSSIRDSALKHYPRCMLCIKLFDCCP